MDKKKERGIKFARVRKLSKSQRYESSVAIAPRLDNHNYRDRRDLNILKRIRPSVRNRTQADYLPNQYIKKVKSDD